MIIRMKWTLDRFASAPNDYAPKSTHISPKQSAKQFYQKIDHNDDNSHGICNMA